MASLGEQLSDLMVLTSDNPRSEQASAIVGEMLAGVKDPGRIVIELDRRKAIALALAVAKSGDVVVIAGKGHEQGQESNGIVTPFDDRVAARELVRELHAMKAAADKAQPLGNDRG